MGLDNFVIQFKLKYLKPLNSTVMGNLHHSDILFATLSNGHNIIVSRIITGAETITDIVRQLRSGFHTGTGLYTLNIRNTTKGWSHRSALAFRA